jgi:molybdopterin converting factor subunit 1
MRIQVLVFARLREILGSPQVALELPAGARVQDAWDSLTARRPALAAERASSRAARNGRLVAFDAFVGDGDELAFLPPVGGG